MSFPQSVSRDDERFMQTVCTRAVEQMHKDIHRLLNNSVVIKIKSVEYAAMPAAGVLLPARAVMVLSE